MSDYLFAPRPRVNQVKYGEIVEVRTGEMQTLLCVSPQVQGVFTHWLGNRSLPCTGYGLECVFDHRRTSQRWQGWIAVQRQLRGRVCYLALTPDAAKGVENSARESNVRGSYMRVGRNGSSRNGKMLAYIEPNLRESEQSMPPPPDLKLWLALLWGPPIAWEGVRPECRPSVARMQTVYSALLVELSKKNGVHNV